MPPSTRWPTRRRAADVETYVGHLDRLEPAKDDSVDVVFVSSIFDHITQVDGRALAEALAAAGFRVEKCIPRLLPYSTQSRLPSWPWLVRLYLRVPLAWPGAGCPGVPGGGSGYPARSRPVRGLGACSSATFSPRAPSRPATPASVTVTARVAMRRSIQRRSSNRSRIRAPSAPARW